MKDDFSEEEIFQIPIDGELDLHLFAPKEIPSLIYEYLTACLEKDIFEVRIIHGKGKGVLRQTVHNILRKHPRVINYGLDSGPSGWGVTIVRLKAQKED